jgi:hypothetical protein
VQIGAMGGFATEMAYRGEHSRSLEDAEKYKAIETLKELGVLIPLSELELYHGRVNKDGKRMQVDPAFKNGDNDSGNANVNMRTTLYTADEKDAREFATARYEEDWPQSEKKRREIARIISDDPDATVINNKFNYTTSLDSAEKQIAYLNAMQALSPSVKGVSIDFKDRDEFEEVLKDVMEKYDAREADKPMVKVPGFSDKRLEDRLTGSGNSNLYLRYNPFGAAIFFVGHIGRIAADRHSPDVPYNLEYMAEFFRSAHIVGVKQPIQSATMARYHKRHKREHLLDKDGLVPVDSTVTLFDLHKVNTERQSEEKRAARQRIFGTLVGRAKETFYSGTPQESSLMGHLADPHAHAGTLVEEAKKIPGYDKIFEASAGNWEGYTLQQHVRTVLEIFNENFADRVPVEIVPLAHLTLLVHDIGKPKAAERGDKSRQLQYNLAEASRFLTKMNMSDETSDFILDLIRGMEFAGSYIVNKDNNAGKELTKLAEKSLKEWLGRGPTKDDIAGFNMLVKNLWMSDSGAYTTMARTVANGIRYRNSGSFDDTFLPPTSITGRDIETKRL